MTACDYDRFLANSPPAGLFTTGDLSKYFDVNVAQVRHALLVHQVPPLGKLGNVYVYGEPARSTLERHFDALAARREEWVRRRRERACRRQISE